MSDECLKCRGKLRGTGGLGSWAGGLRRKADHVRGARLGLGAWAGSWGMGGRLGAWADG